MLVKACGLSSSYELAWARELNYDFTGIILDPQSRRYVREPEKLWRQIPAQWRSRCVLVARSWKNLEAGALRFPEALLQCYDNYPESIRAERRFQPVASEEQYAQSKAAFHLYDKSLGSGEWAGMPSWARGKEKLLVAGGLSLASLRSLAQNEGPSFGGFDLSSGLEKDGKKDFAKMQSCIEYIRASFP